MVMVALALDTPKLSPELMAWEKEPTVPEAAPDEVSRVGSARRVRGTDSSRRLAIFLMRDDVGMKNPLRLRGRAYL